MLSETESLHFIQKWRGKMMLALLAVAGFVAPLFSVASEQSAAGHYLVLTELRKPAVFYYRTYLRNYRYADFRKYLEEGGVLGDRQEGFWKKQFEEVFTEDYFSSIFKSSFEVPVKGSLVAMMEPGDSAEGVPCAVDNDGKPTDNANSASNVPLVVTQKRQEIAVFRETLQNALFTEEDWGKYFRMNSQWHDPAIRRIWVTSWDDISKRWDKFLEAGETAKVRSQIKTIFESGRLESAGGGAWRGKIGKWWNDNAAKVVPKLRIYNMSGAERTVEIDWGTGAPPDTKKLDFQGNFEKAAPFGVEDKRRLKATIRYFVPRFKCCGVGRGEVEFPEPFMDDQQFVIPLGTSLWETTGNATIKITIGNIGGRNLDLSFKYGNQIYPMNLEFKHTDVWTCTVPAHVGGDVMVHEIKGGGKTLLKSLSIKGDSLHRGGTVTNRIELQPVVHLPELRRQKDKSFGDEKRAEDALLKVEIEKGYAIFDGEKSNFSNPGVLDGYEILRSGAATISMKATLANGADPPEDLKPLAARILNPKGNSVGWTGEATMKLNEKPEANTFIRIPRQTFYLGSWQACKQVIDGMEPALRVRTLKALSAVRRSWDGLILEYVKGTGLLPTVRIWNNTGERVELALDGRVFRMDAGEYCDVAIAGTGIPEILVRKILPNGDEPLLDSGNESEYINNVISSKILKWPKEWGESIEYTITAKDIELKPAPVLLLSWPPDLTDVEVVAYGRHYRPTENRMTIELPRWKKLEDLTIISGNYEPYEPKISANLRYFGLRYGQTETPPIPADQLVKKSEPLPEPEQPGINPNKVKRLRRVLQDAVSSLDKSGNRETAEDNIREAMPGKNKTMKALMEDESNTDGDQVKAARSVLTNKLGVDADTVLRIWGWL